MAVYLYTPPTWRHVIEIGKSALVYGVATSTLVYRLAGVWYNVQEAGMDNPVVDHVDIDSRTGLKLFFSTPVVVPGSLHDELAAVTKGDDSWTDGTLTLL